MDISEHTNIEVFSNALVVVNETFLKEVPEDKVNFLNHVGSIAEVNIICNNKGNFTAQGSWRKIITLEETLKKSLRNWTCDAAKRINCSEINYISNDCALNLVERCSEQNNFVGPSNLEKVSAPADQEKSDLESYNSLLIRARPKVSAEQISSLLSNETHYVRPVSEDFKNVKVKESNGNEIYVNITVSASSSISLTSDEPNLTSENPTVSSAVSMKDTKGKKKKVASLCESALKGVAQSFSKQLSEKDKRKLYEQQTPFKFFCTLCSFKSKRESHYKKHLQLHKQGTTKLYVCTKCGFRTIRMGHLRRHELQHASQALKCPRCPYTTDSSTFMQRHQRIKHTSNPNQASNGENYLHCSHCNYMTSQPHFLKRHLRVHGVGGDTKKNITLSYQCEKCTYKTQRKEHFERHRRDVHSEARPFLCDACGKAFKRADALRQHRTARHHPSMTSEEKTTYGSNSSPSQHSLYCCPHCSKPCRSRAHLRDHVATHSDERSFLCEICGSSFKTRAVQRKHIATVHANPKAFPCNRCVRRFSTKYALLRHLKIHGLIKEETIQIATKNKTVVLNYSGVSQTKVSKSGVSNMGSSGILAQRRQKLVCESEMSSGKERMEVGEETQEQLSSSFMQTTSEVVPLIPENKDSGGNEVSLEMKGEMQSISSGTLTRTPAPSETTTALLYLTTDFTQY